jgi:hypothetical protein
MNKKTADRLRRTIFELGHGGNTAKQEEVAARMKVPTLDVLKIATLLPNHIKVGHGVYVLTADGMDYAKTVRQLSVRERAQPVPRKPNFRNRA